MKILIPSQKTLFIINYNEISIIRYQLARHALTIAIMLKTLFERNLIISFR